LSVVEIGSQACGKTCARHGAAARRVQPKVGEHANADHAHAYREEHVVVRLV
jgi:hypothetical protein